LGPPPLASPALLTLALLVAGCSSAAELAAGDSEPSYVNETTGEEPDSAGGETNVTGPAGGTTGASSGSGGGQSTSDGDPSEPTTGSFPEPPPDEPAPVDEAEKSFEDGAECGPDTWLSWELAVREAGAMVSPAQARELAAKQWPPAAELPIRPWEFLNYYTFPYPLAPWNDLKAGVQMRPGTDDFGDMFNVQVAVAGPEVADGDRPPVHLTFALDNSGSMDGKSTLLLKRAVKAMAGQLREGDTVAVTTWNDDAAVLLPVTTVKGPYDGQLLAAVEQFVPDGSAELMTALEVGYGLAKESYVPSDINRLVVISDGQATATPEELAIIAERATDMPSLPGIHTVGVGVGVGTMYRRDLIDAIARTGGGPALFLGSEEEADRQLGERFVSVVGIAALDLEVTLMLPPGLTLVTDVASDVQPAEAHDRVLLAPNDRVLVHRKLRACGEFDPQDKLRVEMRWTDGVTGAYRQAMQEFAIGDLLSGDDALLAKGEAVLTYAELLRSTQRYPGDEQAWTAAEEALKAATAKLPDDQELADIAAVLAALQGL
jgi:Ca-activated chloride channel family protein